MEEKVKGILIIIGGAEEKTCNGTILKRIFELSGGEDASIVIITVATQEPKRLGENYIRAFEDMFVDDIQAIHIYTRRDANSNQIIKILERATCIFFTGGDQLRITSLIGGTKCERVIREKYKTGTIIAGTSAGASCMSETMITTGSDDDSPKKCTLKMAPGLGLLKGTIIDQHFAQRGRVGRLLLAMAQNPRMLGVGIDENTGIVVMQNAMFEVIGSNAVTVLDGIDSTTTNVSEIKPDQILAMTDIKMHVLPTGYKFDLSTRKPVSRR
ncbi:MAG: cyanophycinase [Clostridiales bacterium]|nr:cyanophycinase [Clostridiales bacterium]